MQPNSSFIREKSNSGCSKRCQFLVLATLTSPRRHVVLGAWGRKLTQFLILNSEFLIWVSRPTFGDRHPTRTDTRKETPACLFARRVGSRAISLRRQCGVPSRELVSGIQTKAPSSGAGRCCRCGGCGREASR